MKLEKLEFSIEKGMSKKGTPYTYLKIVNLETGETDSIFDSNVIKSIKALLLEM